MKIAAKDLKPGDTIAFEVDVEHVIVVGPSWEPREVWVADRAGKVHTLDPHMPVVVERAPGRAES